MSGSHISKGKILLDGHSATFQHRVLVLPHTLNVCIVLQIFVHVEDLRLQKVTPPRAWPRLLNHIHRQKSNPEPEDREASASGLVMEGK